MQNDDFIPGRSGAPDLSTKTVVGVFDTNGEALEAARALQRAGIDDTHISLVAQETDRAPDIGAEDTMAGEGAIQGAGVGAVVGGTLAGLVALAVPGVGPLLAAGPLSGAITAALGGALTGAGVGVLAGSFTGLGISKEHAEQYEQAVREGRAILAVKVPGDADVAPIQILLDQQGAREVTSFSPAL